jgi:hypothetical protein
MIETLLRRVAYGGRKGRSARRRLRALRILVPSRARRPRTFEWRQNGARWLRVSIGPENDGYRRDDR